MENSSPFEKTTLDNKEYINMKSDIFYNFFSVMMETVDERDILDVINKKYRRAKTIKKKRIRLKKRERGAS